MKYSLILAPVVALVNAVTVPSPSGCAYDNCLFKDRLAKLNPSITKYCQTLIGSSPPATSTLTVGPQTIITRTVTPNPVTVTATISSTSVVSELVTETQISGTICTTVVTTSATTDVTFPRFTPIQNEARDATPDYDQSAALHYERALKYPDFILAGCRSAKAPPVEKVKTACECFLAPKIVTVTRQPITTTTTLAQQTQTATATLDVKVTSVQTSTSVVETCTSTSTSTVITGGPISSCRAPAGLYASATTGQITCIQPANAPSGSVNAFHRIEADNTQGTVYEGCIYSGPRSITTLSGGTHQCGASTGTSITGQTDAAAMLTGFTYDGSFSPSFNDYFITRIGSTQQSGNSYWGVLNNGVFTTSGGCGAQVRPGDSSLWQWDAFNLATLLTITPQYAVVAVGDPVSLQVTSRNPNGGGSSAYLGALLSNAGGSLSDGNGNIEFTAPAAPGCYQYKATSPGAGRSNAFYLNVVDSFPATIG